MTFAFYNVENLFDVNDDPRTRDNDYTPSGAYHWDREKYHAKIDSLAKVIEDLGPDGILPAFIGFTEVENYKVLRELLDHPRLAHEPYEIIHAESRDQRGIDVAFAYSSLAFKKEISKMICIDSFAKKQLHSRDIMYIKGQIPTGEDLHIFVNHWPSRRDGDEKTRYKRSAAAQTLEAEIKGILTLDKDALIVICGDFNDQPEDYTLKRILKAMKKTRGAGQLMNLAWAQSKLNIGTVQHENVWYMFDQFIVSHSLFPRIKSKKMHILRNDKTIYKSPKTGKEYPNRTYVGSRYTGGVSDHLPVWIEIKELKKDPTN